MNDSDNIANFCQITGTTIDEAFAYMEMAAGDLSTAISLYFDNSGVTNTNNNDYIEEVEDEVEEEDIQEVTEGEYNRILESQEIYRPQRADDQHFSVSIFNTGNNQDDRLAKQFDLPDSLKGPYLLEVARENAIYQSPRKWVLLCLFEKQDFHGGKINRDIFHDPVVREIMEFNFIIVQQVVSKYSDEESEGNRLRTLYNIHHFPYLVIINPLTGGVELTISEKAYSHSEEFIETITNFLSTRSVDDFPAILPSDKISSITAACIKPVSKQTCDNSSKREKPSSPLPTSPAKYSSPSYIRDISTTPGPNACRMRLRLPSTVIIICVDKYATVKELVRYIQSQNPELGNVDILSGNPPVSILTNISATLDELKLNGSVLIVRSE